MTKIQERQQQEEKLHSTFTQLTSKKTKDTNFADMMQLMARFLKDIKGFSNVREVECPDCMLNVGEIKGFELLNAPTPDESHKSLDELISFVEESITRAQYNRLVYYICMIQWQSLVYRLDKGFEYSWNISKCDCRGNPEMKATLQEGNKKVVKIDIIGMLPSPLYKYGQYIRDIPLEYKKNNEEMWNTTLEDVFEFADSHLYGHIETEQK
jgi:hypothetical protein